jgi:ABC-type dipeptide/oligopeptide/nickel transport system ATPase subunit
MSLYEKYRPTTFQEVVGQQTVISTIQEVIESNGFWGQFFYLCGASGTGKTSIARILAQQNTHELCVIETIGRNVMIDTVRYWTDHYRRMRPIWGDGWCFIINEAQDLLEDTLKCLMDFTELVCETDYMTLIFTSMVDPEKLSGAKLKYSTALLSRTSTGGCLYMNDARNPIFREDVVLHLHGLALSEGLGYIDCDEIFDECNGNIRACIGKLFGKGVKTEKRERTDQEKLIEYIKQLELKVREQSIVIDELMEVSNEIMLRLAT